MEEVHKAVLKRKRVHDNKIIPVPDEIRDHNKNLMLGLRTDHLLSNRMVIGIGTRVLNPCRYHFDQL